MVGHTTLLKSGSWPLDTVGSQPLLGACANLLVVGQCLEHVCHTVGSQPLLGACVKHSGKSTPAWSTCVKHSGQSAPA